MQRIEDRFIYSASDLNDYLQCKRLTELEALHALGLVGKPVRDDERADLIRRKGEDHERQHLERLTARLGSENVVRFGRAERSLAAYRQAEEATLAAMRDGAAIVYQATFFDGQFLGHADFLRRVPEPSDLGPWRYEVVDTKLALNPKPYFLVQLCNYSEHLERLQGVAPERGYIVLGDGTEESYRLSEYAAYYRRLKRAFLLFAGDAARAARDVVREYPIPVEHCATCDWDSACAKKRKDDDHLSGVAWMRRDQTAAFQTAGIPTIAALAAAPDDARPAHMHEATFAKLRRQAALQVRGRESGRAHYELVAHEPPMGFALLPAPDDGDVFFDMEGDPLFEPGRGLEYLFGCWMPADDSPFRAFWGCDRKAEKRAFEDFVDFVVARRTRHPDLHVYHYAPYEKVALRRLAQEHCTRENEIDDLLRAEVLVDLYAVVRQSLVVSEDGYSLKKLERFYPLERSTDVKKGDESIVMFERWRANPGNTAILSDIENYNRDDCRSTYLLREWLLERRAEAIRTLGTALPFRAPRTADAPCHADFLEGCAKCDKRRADEREELRISDLERRLLADVLVPQNESEYRAMSELRRAEFLLANLLAYHRREDKPAYWQYFDRRENLDQLLADKEALDGLQLCEGRPIEKIKRSYVYTYSYPEQPHKFNPGDTPHNPAEAAYSTTGTILALDEDRRELRLKWTGSLEQAGLIKSLLPRHPLLNVVQRKALQRIAETFVEGSLEDDRPATYDLLFGRDPRIGATRGARVQPDAVNASSVSAAAQALDGSYLFIQGPPGSGKTTTGAHVICDLLQLGKRVGIASTGHKAMHNLVSKVERQMRERGGSFCGLYKHSDANVGSRYESPVPQPFVRSTGEAKDFDGLQYDLAAGTAWL
ncbi:MAG TPA: TM0106 family RecB-like putative nuclease, partial [Candidatus Tumulicola sp.]|nr:TM0106 family RecB-like putative nuclease [Candidatus Tumulicola sp.]